MVQVEVTPAPGFVGTAPINVHGWDSGYLIGGVTLRVEAS